MDLHCSVLEGRDVTQRKFYLCTLHFPARTTAPVRGELKESLAFPPCKSLSPGLTPGSDARGTSDPALRRDLPCQWARLQANGGVKTTDRRDWVFFFKSS